MEKRFLVNCHCERVKRAWQSICNIFYGLLRHFVPRNDGKCEAFTLAEVLITLTIIGVITALTIPNLMQKWSDHADVAKVKEAYSILSNAVKMSVAENGPMESWDLGNPSDANKNTELFGEIFSKYLKLNKYCGIDTGCLSYGWQADGSHSDSAAGYHKTLNGTIGNNAGVADFEYINSVNRRAKMVLSNGMTVGINGVNNVYQGSTISVFVDTNGKKKPNRMGYDIFSFGISDNKLIPYSSWNGKDYCNYNGRFAGDGARDGASCAYWVLRKGNMDYKYRDVSAEW